MKRPEHLAIIMDGNGRWASQHGHSRVYGHVRGATVARRVIEACSKLKIPHLTLFTFSTENWLRPRAEVAFLMELLFRRLQRELPVLQKNNIRFDAIGELSRMPERLQERVRSVVAETSSNTGMRLTFALSYGGRQEILQAARSLADRAARGLLRADEIDESTFSAALNSSFLPDPDLIIRTSGENRLSNFFLWQAAYSEFFVTDVPWPEFTEQDLNQALDEFARRERRFGRTTEQIAKPEATHSI